MEESKQEKLLNAIFGAYEPKPKSLRFSLNLVSITD